MRRRIPIDRIKPNPDQPRKTFNPKEMEELAASILARGLDQPIRLRPVGDLYEIVFGERRWRAHRLLAERGHKRFAVIEADVKRTTIRDRDIAAIVENLQRADVLPMEEAASYQRLIDQGMTVAEIATLTGAAAFRIEWRLKLLNLSPEIRKLFESGNLDRQQGMEIARLPNHRDQVKVVQMIGRNQLVGWGAVRAAVNAMIGDAEQIPIFADLPPVSEEDAETLSSMERRIAKLAAGLAGGWKNGECIIATKVSRDRAVRMAEKLAYIRSTTGHMERELRAAAAQGRVALGDDRTGLESDLYPVLGSIKITQVA